MQIKRKDISREMVGIGFDVGGMPKGDVIRYITLKALAEILNNRIYDEVREKSGLSYDPGVEYEFHESFGYILASAGSEPGKSSAVKRKILEECNNLTDEGITKKELDRVKHGMRIDFELLKENPVDMATAMLDMELKGIKGKNLLFIGRALDKVTVQSVERYAKRYIDTGRCSTIVLKKY
jgi:predicted Zn-dependent peptidase